MGDSLERLFRYYDGSANRWFVYDGHRMIAETDAAGTGIARRYVFGPGGDEPLVQYEGSGTSTRRFLHADERGSIVATTDGSGSLLSIDAYDEYGFPGAGAPHSRFGYAGQVWLNELGLSYKRARYYSPSFGRFLQTDPIGFGGGMNIYAYTGNDPVNFSDPSGLVPPDIVTGSRLPARQDVGPGLCTGCSGFTGEAAGTFIGLSSGGSGGIIYVPGSPGSVTSTGGTGPNQTVAVTASMAGYFYFAGGFGGSSGMLHLASQGHYYSNRVRICTAAQGRPCHIERTNTEACVLPGHISTAPIVSGDWYAVYASYSDIWPGGFVWTTQTGRYSFRNTTAWLHPLTGTVDRIFSQDSAGNVYATTIGQGPPAATSLQDRVNQERGPEIFAQQNELCSAIVSGN